MATLMTGTRFDGLLGAGSLQVGGSLFMDSKYQDNPSFKDVDLRRAKVAGTIDMMGARFDGQLYAGSLQVDDDLSLRDAHCAQVDMSFAHVGSNLDLRGATLGE
jgi:hypothetical protein